MRLALANGSRPVRPTKSLPRGEKEAVVGVVAAIKKLHADMVGFIV